jgi:hypothetical protein
MATLNYRYPALFFILSFLSSNIKAQNIPPTASSNPVSHQFDTYERASISYIFLNMPSEKYNIELKSLFDKMGMNPKFNNHNLSSLMSIDAPYDRIYNQAISKSVALVNKLNENQAGNKIIAKWFNQTVTNGAFNMDLIAQRGVYNATDEDVIIAKAETRGIAVLQDAGEILIDKSFVVVYDFMNIETWKEYYDRQDAQLAEYAKRQNLKPTTVSRMYSGFKAGLRAYLLKLDWNDSLSAIFYQKAWQDPSYLNKMTIPIKLVDVILIDNISGSQLINEAQFPDNEKLVMLLKDAEYKTMFELSRKNDAFKVKTILMTTKPPKAKVGLKEDVKIDQRFFVYEMQINSKGQKTGKRRGVVRATKYITDNRINSDGNTQPTIFYQDAGGRLYPGMIMEQRYDYGLSFSLGWAQRIHQGPMLRLDYNMSSIFNISQFKIYIQGQLGSQSVKFGSSNTSYSSNSYFLEFGLCKEYAITSNLHLEPFVAVTLDSSWTNLAVKDTSALRMAGIKTGTKHWGGIIGLRVPISIFYWLQIIPSVSVFTTTFGSNTIYDKKLPTLPHGVLGDQSDASNTTNSQSGADNSNANLNKNFIRWDVTLRLKF